MIYAVLYISGMIAAFFTAKIPFSIGAEDCNSWDIVLIRIVFSILSWIMVLACLFAALIIGLTQMEFKTKPPKWL